MKISDFVGTISGVSGLAVLNKFAVQFVPPKYVLDGLGNNGNSATLKGLLMFCDSVQLPGLTQNTTPIRSFGEVREIPYEVNYEPITLTFYVDNTFQVKKMFDIWLLGIQDWTTRKFKYYKDYTTDFVIHVQDMSDETRQVVHLYEAYPKTVSSIQLDYANKDMMKVQVTMMYKYWRSYTKDSVIGETYIQDQLAYPQGGGVPTDYFNNFNQFQQQYNDQYGSPEGLGNATGDTVVYI